MTRPGLQFQGAGTVRGKKSSDSAIFGKESAPIGRMCS